MVKSLVSKLSSSATSTVSIGTTFGGSNNSNNNNNNYNKNQSGNIISGSNITPINGVQQQQNKYRNDPGRFFGDGVQFKAKLIGILEVGEARGDRMCQEALQDLKMAIRAAGEHKQRITIHVTIDGLRLRDEKTGDSLYHHPVHKISFIAQDMTDTRAFGYIFGSPDSGHRFFGIKTDKAASQVVLAMRDLFQVVFELKKKEIELARQQIQSKSIINQDQQQQQQSQQQQQQQQQQHLSSLPSLKNAGGISSLTNDLSGGLGPGIGAGSLSLLGSNNLNIGTSDNTSNLSRDNKVTLKELSPESVADLVDLEQELNSLQRGITQMERITPSDTPQSLLSTAAQKSYYTTTISDDPFGDSFTVYNLLPPPEPGRSRHKSNNKLNEIGDHTSVISNTNIPISSSSGITTNSPISTGGLLLSPPNVVQLQYIPHNNLNSLQTQQPLQSHTLSTASTTLMDSDGNVCEDDDTWLRDLHSQNNVLDTTKLTLSELIGGSTIAPLAVDEVSSSLTPTQQLYGNNVNSIGSASEDRIVKQMVNGSGLTNTTDRNSLKNSSSLTDLFQTTFNTMVKDNLNITNVKSEDANTNSNSTCGSGPDVTTATTATVSNPVMFPRDTDPFSPTRKKSDPFEEGSNVFSKLDPFEFEFIVSSDQISKSSTGGDSRPSNLTSSPANTARETTTKTQDDAFSGHLQVQLPEENTGDSGNASHINSSIRSRPMGSVIVPLPSAAAASSVFRQQTVDVLSSISNKKMPHLFGQSSRFSKRDSNSINMRRLQESDSLSENEAAPEPPPRPDISVYTEPPPLPPKKQSNDIVVRPRNGLPQQLLSNGGVGITNRYELSNSNFVSNNVLTSSRNMVSGISADSPPIPLPCRRVGRSDATYPGPGRPRKPCHTEDDYLAPLGTYTDTRIGTAEIPPLLPPPTQISTRARNQRQQNVGKTHELYENKNEIMQQQKYNQQQQPQQHEKVVADITLSQLLTLSIEELAIKLNVSTSKLSTMTLVELTTYLSEFIENSKSKLETENIKTGLEVALPVGQQSSVNKNSSNTFKINFDREATFVAKFDDTFGENLTSIQNNNISFEANFAQFDKICSKGSQVMVGHQMPAVPPADRYAIFREIIDQELQNQETNLMGESEEEGDHTNTSNAGKFEAQFNDEELSPRPDHLNLNGVSTDITITTSTKIDTKITEVVAQAKDRYAALRDIILVENLFEKPCLQKKDNALEQEEQQNLTHYNGAINEVYDDDFNNEDQDLQQLMNEGTMLAPDSHQQRMGLVDSRGMLMEPSSSALTIEDEDDDDEDEEERDIDANVSTEADHACKTCSMGDDIINGGVSSGESNEKNKRTLTPGKYEQLANSIHQLEQLEGGKFEKLENTPTISITEEQNITLNESSLLTAVNINNLSKSKDDLEIDALMQRAISNLSIESRERNSPAISTTQSLPADISMDNAAKFKASPCTITTQYFHDVSTSPISLSQSPLPIVSKSPISTLTLINKVSQHQSTSPSIPTQLAVVSQLIDVATKKIRDDDATKSTPDSWATFDTMQHYHPKGPIEKRLRPLVKTTGKPSNFLHLPPPPAPASITSQNDTAGESPCSSDPREEAWNRRSGSNVSLGHQIPVLPSSRRWHKKESRHTSSSSRDLSWDDEQVGSQNKRLGNMMSGPVSLTIDRHSYHPRYSRRLNSCDEDYGYEEEFQATRRDQRQMKSKISRSRDNFDLDSPSYYHYGGAVHHTWSSQDFEQARAKAMERAVYERNISHAPAANYDKRGILFPSLPQTSKSSAYDRRTNRGKFYRSEYTRTSNSDFDEFGDSLSTYRDERIGSFEKLKMSRKPDYENVFDETRRTPPSLAMGVGIGGGSFKGARPTDLYAYERDRKSFDRESLESFESLTAPRRRRRSFGSTAVGGPDMTIDPYTTYDNREEYHRYVASEKSRSLRKLTKCSRTSGGGGDIDYERDSDEDHRPPRTHLSGSTCAPFGSGPNGSGVMVTYYYRKKQRLRNKNAQGSSGGRYRDTLTGVMRPNTFDYVTCGNNQTNDEDDDAEDYVDEEEDEEEAMQGDDDDMPTDEDKFERLNRRRHEMHQRIMESEQRRYHDGGSVISSKLNTPSISGGNISSASFGSYNRRSNKGSYASNRLQQTPLTPPDRCNQDYGYDDDDYEQTPTPQSNTSSALPNVVTPNTSTKFHFDVGFESDFNQSSPPPVPIGATTFSSGNSTPAVSSIATIPKQSYRFSNDFSDKEKTKYQMAQQQKFDRDRDNRSRKPMPNNINSTIAGGGGGVQKLRFDDNVKVSQFDDESTTVVAFEDDFSKATFDTFEYVDQWHHEGDNLIHKMPSSGNRKQQIRNSILQQRQQELLKKSESINIFAKKSEDPFEDDDFFKSPASSVAATTTETTLVLTMAPTILLPSSAADVNISSTTTTITTTGSINNSDGGGGNNNGDSGSGSGNGGRSDIGDYAPHSDASHGNLTVNNGSHNFSNIVQQQSQQQHDQSQSTPTTMPASHQWDDSNSNFAKFDENM